MKFSLKQLNIFIAVAKTQNISMAAENLHLTQSACSMAINNLENQLNGALFDRHGKGLTLNDRGRILLPKAMNLMAQAEELEALMIEKNSRCLTGKLTVGASSTLGNYILPAIIGQFMQVQPNMEIALRVGNTEQIIQQLLQFDIDLGLIEGRCDHSKINKTFWRKDQLIIIAHPNHPLANKRKINITDLQNARWILREIGSGTREKFAEITEGRIKPFLELGHTEAIKQAVIANVGISCLSKMTVTKELKHKEIIELKTPFLKLTRDFYLLTHQDKYETLALKIFLNELN